MVVLTVVATWIVPGGEYQRVEKDGRTVPVAGSYHRVESQPQGLGGLFVSPGRASSTPRPSSPSSSSCGGAFNVIQKTGAITAVIHNLHVRRSAGSKALRVLFIPVTMIIFSLGGGVWGMCEETMPFILIFVPLALSLGYDTIVGVAMPFVGAAAGFAGAFFNPFTVGIAQGIAGLPLYSGLGYRLVVWAGGTAIAIAVVMRYAARVRKDPQLSPTYEDDLEKRKQLSVDKPVVEKVARQRPPTGACSLVFAGRLRRHGLRHPQVQVVHQRDRAASSWPWASSPGSSAGSRATRSARPSSKGPRTWSTPP